MNVSTAKYNVKYKGSDITAHVISMEYNDKVHGESDELTLNVEDTDGKIVGIRQRATNLQRQLAT
jgi:phage protein D